MLEIPHGCRCRFPAMIDEGRLGTRLQRFNLQEVECFIKNNGFDYKDLSSRWFVLFRMSNGEREILGICHSFGRNCFLPCVSCSCFRDLKPRCKQFQAAKQILLDENTLCAYPCGPKLAGLRLSAYLPIEGFVHWRGRGTTDGWAAGLLIPSS